MSVVVEFYIPDKYRKKTIQILSNCITKKYCSEIERGIYDFTEQYCKNNCSNNLSLSQSIYEDNVQNLLFNLKNNHVTMQEIKKSIINGTYNPYNLAFLRPDELDKDNWMKIILRKNKTEDILKNLPTIKWKACKICKNTEYFYYQLQTRSADEPMTTFYICKECGKNNRINN
jgi:DNA-directed RNA polymerase subunit M/transcription elongation factor TFIIS